jgi:hypothetical protein
MELYTFDKLRTGDGWCARKTQQQTRAFLQ